MNKFQTDLGWKAYKYSKKSKGWSMYGSYHSVTDKEGDTKIKIDGVLESPDILSKQSPHYAYWNIGSTKISANE